MDFLLESIPSSIRQNLLDIRTNLINASSTNNSIGTRNSNLSVSFDNLLHSTFKESEPAFISISSPPESTMPPLPSYEPSEGYKNFIEENILNENFNQQNLSQINETRRIMEQNTKLSGIQHLLKLNPNLLKDIQNEIISDQEFYNAESLTPEQIDQILKEKKSPFADRTYGGKTVGQLIYDMVHNAGTIPTGPHTINPALILAIMGAESNFGTDPKNVPENPFNIKINGRFDRITDFEESLKIAVNTMYNWAQNRPIGSNESLFDYAGKHYCENYQIVWKPNVEKFYTEFITKDKLAKSGLNMVSDSFSPEKLLMELGIKNYNKNILDPDILSENNTYGSL